MSARHECLHPCPSCARQVRSYEATCPFCRAALPGVCVLPDPPAAPRAPMRAALVFVGAAAIAACGKTSGAGGGCNGCGAPVAVYGPPPMQMDAGPAPNVETPDASPNDSGSG